MAREDLHFKLRIPEELKQRVAAASRANGRSITAEIIARLEASFVLKSDLPTSEPDAELSELLSDIERIKLKLIRLRRP
ncbi:Arc family DNA-binding protein [Rhizobium rhizogenes]|uniref:Arc family DNA-binding protein n=1 Tax=Rhizobium rhizogenes TaxID=359 RepID=UPI001571D6DD|nr:Arc family DNA-binding protein [Rhizobium rhizogenes]NTI27691.1 Arc family DNA-binding protein [Rhizobium rhizogenes]